jgi:dihydrofolate reductase
MHAYSIAQREKREKQDTVASPWHNDTMAPQKISLITSLGARTRLIGRDSTLPWRIPDDLKRFKQITLGHPVIMGRKTYESIGRPLPGRTNIVVTRSQDFYADEVEIARSLNDAIEKARAIEPNEIFVIGGGEIFKQALPLADKLYLTLIDDDSEGDTYFPEYESLFKKETFREEREHESLRYTWLDLER